MQIRHRPFGGARLVRDWLDGAVEVADLVPAHPSDPEGYARRLQALDREFDQERRRTAASALSGGGPEGADRLRRFVDEGGYVVTTGQQPVLFGGPLYVIYKALTAVSLAARLEQETGRLVLPVFWIASEDHDWDEASSSWVLDQENELRRTSLTLPGSADREVRPALHRVPLDASVEPLLEAFLQHLPDSDFAPGWRDLLREAWRPEQTIPEAFQDTLDGLLGNLGLYFIQSHAQPLKEASLPLLLAELERSETTETELRRVADALTRRGYDLQAPILEGGTNVFVDAPEGRERLFRGEDGGFRLRHSGGSVELSALEARAREQALLLSPNVFLRPVVEARVLPTLAYVAGPGEAAYLAQIEPLFQAHGVTRPVIHPRLSAELIEGKVGKVLEKYELASEELVRPHHELAGRLLREDLPQGIRRELGSFRGALAQHTRGLSDEVGKLDPTLKPTVEQVRSQGFAQLDEVERKVVQALKRENKIALAQLAKAQEHLFPEGKPQERVLSPWYYLFRYGRDLVGRLATEANDALVVPARWAAGSPDEPVGGGEGTGHDV